MTSAEGEAVRNSARSSEPPSLVKPRRRTDPALGTTRSCTDGQTVRQDVERFQITELGGRDAERIPALLLLLREVPHEVADGDGREGAGAETLKMHVTGLKRLYGVTLDKAKSEPGFRGRRCRGGSLTC